MQSSSKIKTYFSLFVPSSLGIVLYVFLAALGIVLNQYGRISHYLQLPHDLQLGRMMAHGADQALTALIGQSRTETLVVGLFWAAVGLVVYIFLRGLARIALELDDDLSVRGYVWPRGEDRLRPLHDLAEQFIFRAAACAGIVLVIFQPLAAVLRGPVFADFLGPSKPLQYAVWFVAGLLVWHILVVLLRLAALRARLFG